MRAAALLVFSLSISPALAATDSFPHELPLSAELDTEPASLEESLFSERARERSLLSLVASADAVFDTFGARALVDGVSAGVLLSELLEIMATARHIASWEPPTFKQGITGGFQLGARIPLDIQSRYWIRVGFELGFSPGGPVSLLARVHLQVRVRLGSSVWLGLSPLNPVVRTYDSRSPAESAPRLGLMSGLELCVVL